MRKWNKIADNIYVVGGAIYFRAMVNYKREMIKSPVQGPAALDGRGRPTVQLRAACNAWLLDRTVEKPGAEVEMRVPTFGKLLQMYEVYSVDQRIKTGKPSRTRVRHVLFSVRHVMEACGFSEQDTVDKITTDKLDEFAVGEIKRGLSCESARAYVTQFLGSMAKWTRPYYRRERYEAPVIERPQIGGKSERYERPSKDALADVRKWYQKLWDDGDKVGWLYATMMLQFAMRNVDVELMTREWFQEVDGVVYLTYTPHKTSLTSRRRVRAVVHTEIWARMLEVFGDRAPGEQILGERATLRNRLNHELRSAVPDFAKKDKGLYELRKVCVDHVYQKFGAEAASAISGDDIKTLSYYYAQPDMAAPMAVRIDEMI